MQSYQPSSARLHSNVYSRSDFFFLIELWLCLYFSFSIGNATIPTSKLVWSSMDDPLWKLDSYSLKPMAPPPYHTMESEEINYQDYSLVVTGDVFRWMLNYAPLETVQRVCINGCLIFVWVLIYLADACQDADFCKDVTR